LGVNLLHAVTEIDQSHYLRGSTSKEQPLNPDESEGELNQYKSADIFKPLYSNDNQNNFQISSNNLRCLPDYVRVLVLYTPNAASYGNVHNIASLAMQETNNAYSNSGIQDLTTLIVSIQPINFNEGFNIETDLLAFMNDTPNLGIDNLRQQTKADVVVLLTDGANYGVSDGVTSFDLLSTPPGDYDLGYALVQIGNAAGPDYVFAHEIGHIQGAHHHPSDDSFTNENFSYGYGQRVNVFGLWRRSTIMAYTFNNLEPGKAYPRLAQFSNPNNNFNGYPLGISGQRENYLVIQQTAPVIADIINANELRTTLSTSIELSTNEYTFTAQPCGGSGSYSYEWRLSDDFYISGPVVSTTSVYQDILQEGTWYITLKVSDSSDDAYWSTEVEVPRGGGGDCSDPMDPCFGLSSVDDDNENLPAQVELMAPYPNPFNPSTTVSFTLPSEQAVQLKVFDLAGREVATIFNGVKAAGTHHLQFNASVLSSGNYLVRLEAGNTIKTHTITLIK
jgi:hypothetical protein